MPRSEKCGGRSQGGGRGLMGHCKDLGFTPGKTGSCDDLERRRSGLLLRRDSRGKDGAVDTSEGAPGTSRKGNGGSLLTAEVPSTARPGYVPKAEATGLAHRLDMV